MGSVGLGHDGLDGFGSSPSCSSPQSARVKEESYIKEGPHFSTINTNYFASQVPLKYSHDNHLCGAPTVKEVEIRMNKHQDKLWSRMPFSLCYRAEGRQKSLSRQCNHNSIPNESQMVCMRHSNGLHEIIKWVA